MSSFGLSIVKREGSGTSFLNQVNPHYKTTSKPSQSEAYREQKKKKKMKNLKLILSLFLHLPTVTFIHDNFAEAALPCQSRTLEGLHGREQVDSASVRPGWLQPISAGRCESYYITCSATCSAKQMESRNRCKGKKE